MTQFKFICFLFAIISAVGCSVQNTNMIGSYKSKEFNKINRGYLYFFKNAPNVVIGSTLNLKADSTFHLVNCGNTIDGKWQIHQDSLLLFCEDNKWNNDSLNIYGYNGDFLDCGNGAPYVYIIEKDVLKNKVKPKGKTVLNYFEKVK